MPTYHWKGIDSAGKQKNGALTTQSPEHLKNELLKQGIALLEYSSKNKTLQHTPFFSSKKITQQKLITFFEHMATLVVNGIQIIKALHLFSEQTTHHYFKKIIQEIAQSIQKGQALSQALKKFPKVFEPFIVQTIQAGEKTGKLGLCLENIKHYLEEKQRLKKEISQATLLPIITLVIGSIIITGIFVFIIPQFKEFFELFDKPMPQSTAIVFAISSFLRTKTSLLLVLGLFTMLIVLKLLTKRTAGKQIKDLVISVIPYFNNIVILTDRVAFLHTTSLLLQAGIPLKEALEDANGLIKNSRFKQKNETLLNTITQGGSLEQAFTTIGKNYYPENVTALVAIGEQTGSLDVMLHKAFQLSSQHLKKKLTLLTTLLQPLLLITVGLIIAGLMLAVYLPIFSLAGNFG